MDIGVGASVLQGTKTADGHAEVDITLTVEGQTRPQFVIVAEIKEIAGKKVIVIKRK